MTPFETALMKELARIRKLFADRNVGELSLTIECSGPTMRDEMKVHFRVDGTWEDKYVEGSNIDAVVEEFFRRKGWKKANDYLALPNVESQS